jgi:hypothetical protein
MMATGQMVAVTSNPQAAVQHTVLQSTSGQNNLNSLLAAFQ